MVPFSSLVNHVAANCGGGNFLGLVPWYRYLRDCKFKEFNLLSQGGTPSDLPLVLLALVDNLLRIAGLIAVIFVVYGAIMYTTSQGQPDEAAKAQSTIINALIGLVVAIVAVAFVSFIGNRLT